MDRGARWATVHRVTKSRTRLSDYTYFSFFHPLHRMSLRDFKAHFMLLVICKLSPGLLTQEVGQKWSYTLLEGRWKNGSTAGGRMKSPRGESVCGSQRRSCLMWQLLQAKVGLWAELLPGHLAEEVGGLCWPSCVCWPWAVSSGKMGHLCPNLHRGIEYCQAAHLLGLQLCRGWVLFPNQHQESTGACA